MLLAARSSLSKEGSHSNGGSILQSNQDLERKEGEKEVYWKTQAHTGRLFVDYAALSNNRCVYDQLREKG